MNPVIWWVRRDLRLTDNQALTSALETGQPVIPVFILDPVLLASPTASAKRSAFLMAGLRELDQSLRQLGSYLIVRQGDPLGQLEKLMVETQAQAIYAEPDYSRYATRRDRKVTSSLPIHWVGSPAVMPPGSVVKNNSEPYTVFTPFSRAWKALCGLQPGMQFVRPQRIETPPGIASLPLPGASEPPAGVPFVAGEVEAQRRLASFTQQPSPEIDPVLPPVYCYALVRDRLDLQGTSQLSAYLRFGMLSPRQVVSAALQAIRLAPDEVTCRSAETWLNELIWRDYYTHILYHFPRVQRANFRLPNVHWENNPQAYAAWCEGKIGYPVVDAAMQQLEQSGWMHNRARMIVASFLTKDLLIDWRWGERWFMQRLVDGDPAANNGGWQWTAGTGTDAAPYFRIFNPVSQSRKHDPQGEYIRRWLPALRQVPDVCIHEPWNMPDDVQKAAGCVIGRDYPAPIVDHSQARQRALNAYQWKGIQD